MLFQQLTLSYEALSSIGNSLEIESMMSEVLITFSRKTGAVSGSYYQNTDDKVALISIGKKIPFNIQSYEITDVEYLVFLEDDKQMVVLPLKRGYMLFIYKNKKNTIEKLASMLGNFKNKINLSISACEGVSNLEKLNEKLEERVESSIKKIRKNEKILIAQSKQAVMGEMIEMIAHQWRQPITSIGMISNNIIFDIALGELNENSLKNELDKINTQVMYLSRTIDDFRDFFKESKTKNKIVIGEILDGVMILLERQLEKNNINVTIKNRAQDVKFFTFKNEFIQVLLNILGNSKDAFEINSIENAEILIECDKVDDYIEVNIRDNAGGISYEVLPKIFEPYFSTKKKKNGTGLGLYMSMIIVTEHLHGNIQAINIDNGVEFKIKIPIKENFDK